MKRLLLVLVCLGLVGCATTTGDADRVRVTSNPETIKGCKFIGEVHGGGGWGNPFNSVSMTGENAMRKHAYSMGADTVLISYQHGHGALGVTAGEAYQCHAPITYTSPYK